MNVSIIGLGRYGQYLTQILQALTPRWQIHGYDPALGQDNRQPLTRADLVFYAVPIRHLRDAARHTNGSIPARAEIVQTCSVQTMPCAVMAEELPGYACAGLHTLFGPQSAPVGPDLFLRGTRFAVIENPQPMPLLEAFGDALVTAGSQRFRCTPDEHDRQMATQMLTHFIGRGAERSGYHRKVDLSTRTHENLSSIIDIVTGNSEELFLDLCRFNPYAKAARQAYLEALTELDEEIDAPATAAANTPPLQRGDVVIATKDIRNRTGGIAIRAGGKATVTHTWRYALDLVPEGKKRAVHVSSPFPVQPLT